MVGTAHSGKSGWDRQLFADLVNKALIHQLSDDLLHQVRTPADSPQEFAFGDFRILEQEFQNQPADLPV